MIDKEFELMSERHILFQKSCVRTSSGATQEQIAAKREKLKHILYNARKAND